MMGQETSTRASVQRYAQVFIIYCSFANFALPSTQPRREGGNPFPSCFVPHRRDEKESPPSCRVTFHTDTTRREVPFPLCYPPQRHDESRFPPSRHVLFHTDATRGGFPLPAMLPSTDVTRGGETPSRRVLFIQMR